MTYQKFDAQICQWLDKHPNGDRDNTFCIPQLFLSPAMAKPLGGGT